VRYQFHAPTALPPGYVLSIFHHFMKEPTKATQNLENKSL